MDLWVREARLFKYGSGTGTNFSRLRGEDEKLVRRRPFLRPDELPEDRRPGGRRHQVGRHDAPRRQDGGGRCRPSRHRGLYRLEGEGGAEGRRPRRRLAASSRSISRPCMQACVNCEGPGEDCFDPPKNPALKREIKPRQARHGARNYIKRVIQFARQGYTDIDFDTYDTDWDSEAYLTVAGQNSNNTVRVTDAFLDAVENDGDWNLTARITGKIDEDAEGPRAVGQDRPCRLGIGRSRHPVPHAPSTTGTPARPAGRSAPPIRARNTCSSTTRPAISPR